MTEESASNSENDAAGYASKEWLRSRIVGQHVLVTVDYERAVRPSGGNAADASEEAGGGSKKAHKHKNMRIFGTVKICNIPKSQAKAVVARASASGKSINQGLIAEGLALAMRHKVDEPRSSEYDVLLITEAEAAFKNKGVHSVKGLANAPRIIDYSTDCKCQ